MEALTLSNIMVMVVAMTIAVTPAYPTIPVKSITSARDLARYLVNLARNIPRGSGVYIMLDSSLDPEYLEEISKILEDLGFRRTHNFPGKGVIVRREGSRIVFEASVEGFTAPVASIEEHEIPALAEEIRRILSKRSRRVRRSHAQLQNQQPPQGQQSSQGSGGQASQG